MKKRLCIFLICWLPCFVMAANVMAMQMLIAQTNPVSQEAHDTHTSHQMEAMSEMPCHEHQAPHESDSTASSKAHHCDVCGFCAISGGVAHFHTAPDLAFTTSRSVAPLFMAAPVHSQTYPPAIKPPIFS
ncbi:MAG: hypothetical protein ACAH08_06530, partial [Methylophilus sp.]|uniref:hypothetical protein n=1 Tax=Methylophilus sp. TaxID=29541 RepID=UPI002CF42845